MCTPSPKLAEMSCALIDLLLADAFEWRELEDFIRTAIDACVPIPELLAGVPHPEQTFHVAHALCHRDAAFARRLERRLDRRHASWRTLVGALEAQELADRLLAGDGPDPADLPGAAWALARDPRPEVRRVVPAFLARAQLRAFRTLTAPAG